MECCGTCKWWRGDKVDNMRQCLWPAPDLPFWATISIRGGDHADWTQPDEGKDCPVWQHESGDTVESVRVE